MGPKKIFQFVAVAVAVAGCDGGGLELPPDPALVGNNIRISFSSGEPAVTDSAKACGVCLEQTIGAAGGSLVSADGRLTVTIPANAVASKSAITLEPIENVAPGGLGSAYRLGPPDLVFNQAIKLTFSLTEAEIYGTSLQAIGVARHEGDGRWAWLKGAMYDTGGNTVSYMTTVTGDWTAATGIRLDVSRARVVTDRLLDLRMEWCVVSNYDGDYLAHCSSSWVDPATRIAWFVERRQGGGFDIGSIESELSVGEPATFHAPAVVPLAGFVTVSARWKMPSIDFYWMAHAHVRITDPKPIYVGNFTYYDEDTNVITGEIRFDGRANSTDPTEVSETQYYPSSAKVLYPKTLRHRTSEWRECSFLHELDMNEFLLGFREEPTCGDGDDGIFGLLNIEPSLGAYGLMLSWRIGDVPFHPFSYQCPEWGPSVGDGEETLCADLRDLPWRLPITTPYSFEYTWSSPGTGRSLQWSFSRRFE